MLTYQYIFRRLLYAIPILMGVTLLIFVLFNLVAPDPALVLLGKYANPKQMQAMRHAMGLDRPLLMQYIDMLKSVFTFSFGRSWATQQQICLLYTSPSPRDS